MTLEDDASTLESRFVSLTSMLLIHSATTPGKDFTPDKLAAARSLEKLGVREMNVELVHEKELQNTMSSAPAQTETATIPIRTIARTASKSTIASNSRKFVENLASVNSTLKIPPIFANVLLVSEPMIKAFPVLTSTSAHFLATTLVEKESVSTLLEVSSASANPATC
jgi:hypothetical protein